MEKIIFLVESLEDPRYLRLVEEAQQRSITIIPIQIYEMLIDGAIIKDGKNEIDIRTAGQIFWAFSNAKVNHYLAAMLDFYNHKIWPDKMASNLADKYYTFQFFNYIGIPTPKTYLYNTFDCDDLINKIGGYPLVIKKNVGSKGRYVELVNSKKDVEAFVDNSKNCCQNLKVPFYQISFLFQEYIHESAGTDFRVLCLGDEILGAIKRTAKSGFKANISLGGKAEQVSVDPELEQLCKKIMKEGKLFYAGIDFIQSKSGYLAIEINTSAQFQGFEQATGINVAGKIIEKLLNR